MIGIRWLAPGDPPDAFPDVADALREPNGLLAAGGDLSTERLLSAYRRGIFPWYEPGQPVLWWAPDPRAVLLPEELHVSRSLRRRLRRGDYQVGIDRDFDAVVAGCAAPRPYASGTWITPELRAAFLRLHRAGHAHCLEVRRDGSLIGGIYGLALGRVFFGESMFGTETDASKIALVHLVERLRRHRFELLDCQISSPHLYSLGSRAIRRSEFNARLQRLLQLPPTPGLWQD